MLSMMTASTLPLSWAALRTCSIASAAALRSSEISIPVERMSAGEAPILNVFSISMMTRDPFWVVMWLCSLSRSGCSQQIDDGLEYALGVDSSGLARGA